MIKKFWWGNEALEGVFIGLNRVKCVGLNLLEVWVFGSSKSLMTLCYASKFSAYYKTKILYSSSSSKQKFSHMGQFLMLRKIKDLLLGKAF